MGYAKEKEQTQRKLKIIKRTAIAVVCVLLAVFCVIACICPPNLWKYYVKLPKVGKWQSGTLRVHFIDVGQGDATVIQLPDGKVALIDGGDGSEDANRALLRYLNALDVDEIDYLFLTHADEDHFGGLTSVLEYKSVAQTFLPILGDKPTDSNAYAQFLSALTKSGCPYRYACCPYTEYEYTQLSVTAGEFPYTFTVLYPYVSALEGNELNVPSADSNEASVAIYLEYQGTGFLFTGDAPKSTEDKLVFGEDVGLYEKLGITLANTEILKVAHHGSDESTSEAFLGMLKTKTAIISCGAGNAYGHPSLEVCQRLTATGATVYRTDLQGSVVVTAYLTGNYKVETLGK